MVFHLVPGNAEEPGAERGFSSKLFQVFPSGEEYFLNQIVHELGVWDEPSSDVAIDVVCMAVDELCRRLAVLTQDFKNQLRI
jgi:hypothetical protein